MFDTTGLENYLSNELMENEQGVWVTFPGDRSIHILRAGGSNHKFNRTFQNAVRPLKRKMDNGTLSVTESNELMYKVYARSVVIGWKGITDGGKPVPCTESSVVEFFKTFPELFDELMGYAQDRLTFLQEVLVEAKTELGKS